MSVVLIVVLAAVGMILLAGYIVSAPRYAGPVSDHFNGRTFQNQDGVQAKGFREFLGWVLNRHRTEPWDVFHHDAAGPPPPARVDDATIRVTFINHATVLLQFDGINVLTDPVYYRRVSPVQFAGPERHRPPGIRFEDLPKIDVLLLSHNHWDHLDIGTVQRLSARDQPTIVCPLGVKAFLEKWSCQRVEEMDWGQQFTYANQLTIHCVPAQHFSGRGLFDRNATLWAGYVLCGRTEGPIYFAGDSGYAPFFQDIGRRFGPLRLALLPIGAYKPPSFMAPIHCSPAQAVQIHEDVKSRQSIAIHFGTFPLADDGETEPVTDLSIALADKNIPAASFRALKNGESIVIG